MLRIAALGLVLGACTTPSVMGMFGGGPVFPVGDSLAEDVGVEMKAMVGVDDGGGHLSLRRAGDTQEVAIGTSGFHIAPLTKNLLWFFRLGVNFLEWDRVGTDDGAGIGGTTIELGIGQGAGMCASLTATRDFRFNDRDDTFFGVNASLCGLHPRKYYKNPFTGR